METHDQIEALNGLLPKVQAHLPDIGGDIATLVAELRMISGRGFTPPRRLLDLDLGNLVHSLEGILDFKMAGLMTPDVEVAEAETRTLLLDMRKRASDAIRERGSQLRVHSEVASGRADPDIQARDLTDSFRVLAAQPIDAVLSNEDAGMVIHDLGLPDIGGNAGRVMGSFLHAEVKPSVEYGDANRATPLGSAFLPAGSSIRLQKGDQITIHHQGSNVGGDLLSISKFQTEGKDLRVEALADDVIVFGPATLSPHSGTALSDLLNAGTAMKSGVKSQWFKVPFSPIFSFGTFPCFVFFAMTLNLNQSNTATVICGGMGFLLNAALGSWGLSPFRMRSLKEKTGMTADEIGKTLKTILGVSIENLRSATTPMAQMEISSAIISRIKKAELIRFYPVRKVVVRTGSEVPVIRPLTAIAHTPSVPVDFASKKKVS